MASQELTPAQLEIASSISQDEIPIKLRCANCNRFAINAVKLPCCDQSICTDCRATLSPKCPVCEHEPINPDDCKPNKALRLTIRAWLKQAEKKRENASVPTPVPQATPVIPTPSAVEVSDHTAQASTSVEADAADNGVPTGVTGASAALAEEETRRDSTALATEPEAHALDETERAGSAAQEQQNTQHDETVVDQDAGEQDGGEEEDQNAGEEQNAMQNGSGQPGAHSNINGFGFDGMQNGMQNAMGMDWNNPMMQNMMMQMQNPAWGNNFPNMMMQNMGMNPMDYNNMFGNFGMPGMNMGMDFGGYGNWGNQVNGGFGASGGYDSQYGGFNNQQGGNFNPMQQNEYAKNNHYQNQNHFRGQGQNRGRGRGHFQGAPSQDSLQGFAGRRMSTSRPISRQSSTAGSAGQKVPRPNAVEGDNSTAPEDATNDEKTTNENAENLDQTTGDGQTLDEGKLSHEDAPENDGQHVQDLNTNMNGYHDNVLMDNNGMSLGMFQNGQMGNPMFNNMSNMPFNQGYDQFQFNPNMQQGYNSRGRGRGRGGMRGRGGFFNNYDQNQFGGFQQNQMFQEEPKGVVGAPLGPKAWREGQPNTSFRGRGGFQNGIRGDAHINGHGPDQMDVPKEPRKSKNPQDCAEPIELYLSGEEDSSDDEHESKEELDQSISRQRSRSPQQDERRSRSRARDAERQEERDYSRSKRTRSVSTEDESRRRDTKKSKSSRREEDETISLQKISREQSVETSSRHRSRRDDREREKDRHTSSRSHRDSSKRRRRHRSKSRSRSPRRDEYDDDTYARDKNTSDSRDKHRDKDRDRHSRHRDDDRRKRRDRDDDRDRERDRDRDRDRARDKDRDKDKDRKRSHRHRSRSRDADSDSEYERSKESRRRRKEKERDREREKEKESKKNDADSKYDMTIDFGDAPATNGEHKKDLASRIESGLRNSSSKAVAAKKADPAAEEEEEFSIMGKSRERMSRQPPTGPASLQKQPPTGPRAQVNLQRLQTQVSASREPPKGPAAMAPPTGPRKASQASIAPKSPATRESSVTNRSKHDRRPSQSEQSVPASAASSKPSTPTLDPYQQEREARQRERMLKEEERRRGSKGGESGAAGGALSRKRSFADVDDRSSAVPTGPRADSGRKSKSARMSYQDESGDKVRKGEAEREAKRWR